MLRKNRAKKLVIPLSIGMAAAIPIAALSATTISSSTAAFFVYQDRVFSSLNSMVKYFLATNKDNINKLQVIGSVNDAIIDPTYRLLSKQNLPDYDPSKISFAYQVADGTVVDDYSKAANSFTHNNLIFSEYSYPGSNVTYKTERQALEAREVNFGTQLVAETLVGHPVQVGDLHLNPTNPQDINQLKSLLIDKINQIGLFNNNPSQFVGNNPFKNDWELNFFNSSFSSNSAERLFRIDSTTKSQTKAVSGENIADDPTGSLDLNSWENQLKLFEVHAPQLYKMIVNDKRILLNEISIDFEKRTLNVVSDVSVNDYSHVYSTYDDEYWTQYGKLNNFFYTVVDKRSPSGISGDNGNLRLAKYVFDEAPRSFPKTLKVPQNLNPGAYSSEVLVRSLESAAATTIPTLSSEGSTAGSLFGNIWFRNKFEEAYESGTPYVFPNGARAAIDSTLSFSQPSVNISNNIAQGISNSIKKYDEVFGPLLAGTPLSDILLPQLAKLNKSVPMEMSFADSRFRVDTYAEAKALDQTHIITPRSISNVKSKFGLSSLFGLNVGRIDDYALFSKIYQAKVDLSHAKDRLKYVISYKGVPVFEVKRASGSNQVTLKSLIDYNYSATDESMTLRKSPIISDSNINDLVSNMTKMLKNNDINGLVELFAASSQQIYYLLLSRTSIRQQQNASTLWGTEVYTQYLKSLREYFEAHSRVMGESGQGDLVAKMRSMFLPLEEFVDFRAATKFKSTLVNFGDANATGWGAFNPSLFSAQANSFIKDLSNQAEIEAQRNSYLPQISTISVIYDKYNQPQLVSSSPLNNSRYDSRELAAYNLIREKPVVINETKVFVKVSDLETKLVTNKVTFIYELTNDGIRRYFETYDDLVNWVTDYLKREATQAVI